MTATTSVAKPVNEPVPEPAQAKALALARLQASRAHLIRLLQPAPSQGVRGWLTRPLGALARWWRRAEPAVAVGRWLHGQPREAQALQAAGKGAVAGVRQWVGRHPVAGAALALAIGVVVFRGRARLGSVAKSVAQGVAHQGQSWLLKRLSDPALYVMLGAWLGRVSSGSAAPAPDGPVPAAGQAVPPAASAVPAGEASALS